ncbi:MAG: hypothetical protein QG664_46 [Patescibacteria group bacterium]|nr:hypothetical protein [Patescibacteria group bacterium]
MYIFSSNKEYLVIIIDVFYVNMYDIRMKETTKSARLLNLRKSEEGVLLILKQMPLSVADITRLARLPRMTVFQTLKSLKKRNLAKTVLVGKRYHWMRIETSQTGSLLQMTFDALISSGELSERKLFIETYEGAEKLFVTLRNLFEVHPGERLVGFQSTHSAKECMEALGMERVIALNTIIREKGIIVEAVLGKNFVEFGKQYGSEWEESYVGRAAAITIVPEEYLKLEVDVFVFRRSLLVIHWKEKHMLEVIHPDIVNTFRKLTESFALLGRKIDINALIKEKSHGTS